MLTQVGWASLIRTHRHCQQEDPTIHLCCENRRQPPKDILYQHWALTSQHQGGKESDFFFRERFHLDLVSIIQIAIFKNISLQPLLHIPKNSLFLQWLQIHLISTASKPSILTLKRTAQILHSRSYESFFPIKNNNLLLLISYCYWPLLAGHPCFSVLQFLSFM